MAITTPTKAFFILYEPTINKTMQHDMHHWVENLDIGFQTFVTKARPSKEVNLIYSAMKRATKLIKAYRGDI